MRTPHFLEFLRIRRKRNTREHKLREFLVEPIYVSLFFVPFASQSVDGPFKEVEDPLLRQGIRVITSKRNIANGAFPCLPGKGL